MVLPAPVYAIKLLGWVQGVLLVRRGSEQMRALSRDDVASSALASPHVLLAYRAAMLAICLCLGLVQLAARGPVVFVFFTVWNWWLLTLFFAVAVAASARAVLDRRRPAPAADRLDKAVVALFHVVAPMAFVIDAVTWAVLVPMLMADPDPKAVARWRRLMFSATSYMQHGANAGMVTGELLLNRIPPYLMLGAGWMALWNSAFGVWSTLFFARTGTFIYPFLEAHKPYAWAVYIALYAGLTGACLQFVWVVRGKQAAVDAAVRRWGPRPGAQADVAGGCSGRRRAE